MFDWIRFLKRHNVEYVTRGGNVPKGFIAVKCPFCSDDPSEHMTIGLYKPVWGCWRNRSHSGGSPVRLIKALIGVGTLEAQRLVEHESPSALSTGDLLNFAVTSFYPKKEEESDSSLSFPKEIKPIVKTGLGKLFFNYLKNRGYKSSEIDELVDEYRLRYCIEGYFTYRIIFPVYGLKKLMTWTGRSVDKSVEQRYLTLSPDQQKMNSMGLPAALCSVKDLLWNMPSLFEDQYDKLIVTEGPFDALRLDFLGKKYGIRSTCTFGKGITDDQLAWLNELSSSDTTKKFYILYDDDATLDAIRTLWGLQRFCAIRMPKTVADPAEMELEQLLELVN